MIRRLERLLGLLQDTAGDGRLAVPMRLCMVCPAAVGVDGAGVSLITGHEFTPLVSSDPVAGQVEHLQASLNEGPCYDAVTRGGPVLAPDLATDEMRERWPAFSKSALDAGVRAVFGFPITFEGKPVGALDMYSRTMRSLSVDDIDDAIILADLTAIAIHDLAEPGRLDEVGLYPRSDEPWTHRAVVHHATGMTAVHLGIAVDEAIVRLRAHAFAANRSLTDVATDVVARRLRLEQWNDTR